MQPFEKYPVLKLIIDEISNKGLSLKRWNELLNAINDIIVDLEAHATK